MNTYLLLHLMSLFITYNNSFCDVVSLLWFDMHTIIVLYCKSFLFLSVNYSNYKAKFSSCSNTLLIVYVIISKVVSGKLPQDFGGKYL